MFVSKQDALICALSKGIGYCVGKIKEEEYNNVIKATFSTTSYEDKIVLLNSIEKLRAVHVSDNIDKELLSSKVWFQEAIQADKSCAVLYSDTEESTALLLFYDKECLFYVIDYIDPDNVPFGALVRDMLSSSTVCIAYPDEIPDIYTKAIILQGKED